MINSEQRKSGMFRKPVRITITIPHTIFQQLQQRSDQEGRSISNLSAFLLEGALSQSSG